MSNIGEYWSNKISMSTWFIGKTTDYSLESNAQIAYNYELGINSNKTITYNAKIGLMYLSEYYYGASPTYWIYRGYDSSGNDYSKSLAYNWLNQGFTDWTITSNLLRNEAAYYIQYPGNSRGTSASGVNGIRPVFYLVDSIVWIDGEGTKNLPYRIM